MPIYFWIGFLLVSEVIRKLQPLESIRQSNTFLSLPSIYSSTKTSIYRKPVYSMQAYTPQSMAILLAPSLYSYGTIHKGHSQMFPVLRGLSGYTLCFISWWIGKFDKYDNELPLLWIICSEILIPDSKEIWWIFSHTQMLDFIIS